MSDHGSGSILPFLSELEHFLHEAQSKRSVHITASQLIWAFVIVVVIFFIFSPTQSLNNFNLVFFLSPIWLPAILLRSAIGRFVQTKRAEFLAKQEYVLLEIRMPRDTSKTPRAMEAFFSNMHIGSGESTWYRMYIQGAMRPWWSLEIVSLGGRIHFYIWTRAGFRRLIESYLYAQYPDVEIIEAEDYSRLLNPSDHEHDMWGCEYRLSQPDPVPIKTYVDYDMKPGDKPEETVDPLAQILELMGSIGPGEQLWLQFIIRQNKGEKFVGQMTKDGKPYTFKDQATELIAQLRDSTVKKSSYVDPVSGKTIETSGFPNPTKGQNERIAAMERKVAKQNFDVGIRCIYSGTKEAFNGIMITSQLSLFKPFNSEAGEGNSLGVQGVFGGAFNDFPWEDPGGHHREHLKHEIVDLYRRRIYYAAPYIGNWNILSTEELASLYHVPSSAITTPNLPRIQSTTSGAPANLPS
ncbi:MAG: hypothetical protein P4M11_01625 [Candidatus Pacebacteria bacterium]|nr:hypothetical protein [Candidatus Paceibacterota bacterium]